MGKFTGRFRARPWLPDKAISYLDLMIEPTWWIVETGAGASTFWMAERASRVITFEHNPAWAEAVAAEAAKRKISNITMIHDPEYPKDGLARSLQEIGINKCDLALIDGRGRVKSIETIFPFIAIGGWIVLDNANRPRYEKAHRILADAEWRTTIAEGRIQPENKRGFTQFWQRPMEQK